MSFDADLIFCATFFPRRLSSSMEKERTWRMGQPQGKGCASHIGPDSRTTARTQPWSRGGTPKARVMRLNMLIRPSWVQERRGIMPATT